MSARLAIALGLLVAGLAAAAAQPTIPPGDRLHEWYRR